MTINEKPAVCEPAGFSIYNLAQVENAKGKDKLVKKPLREGIDFYLENGYLVFTEKFLRERGYCCQSGCRHCPYGFKK